MLLVGRQERHPTSKSPATAIPKSLLLGNVLTWSNSGKVSITERVVVAAAAAAAVVVVVVVVVVVECTTDDVHTVYYC